MERLGTYTFLVMTSVRLSGGMNMRDEHGPENRSSCHGRSNSRIAAVPLEALQARLAVRVSVAVPRARPTLIC